MRTMEKNRLSQEARLQIKALGRIERWMKTALVVSAVGVASAYAGFGGGQINFFFGICGILLILCGLGCAAVCNLGLKNGRRNVEKIPHLLDGGAGHETV